MKICKDELTAVIYGAGGPSAGSAFGNSAVEAAAVTSATMVGNHINGDDSFQSRSATVVGGFVGYTTYVATTFTTGNPLAAGATSALTSTVATNFVNNLDPAKGPAENVSAMGDFLGPVEVEVTPVREPTIETNPLGPLDAPTPPSNFNPMSDYTGDYVSSTETGDYSTETYSGDPTTETSSFC